MKNAANSAPNIPFRILNNYRALFGERHKQELLATDVQIIECMMKTGDAYNWNKDDQARLVEATMEELTKNFYKQSTHSISATSSHKFEYA